jgi:hypothetical protein
MAGTQNLRYATEYQLDGVTLISSVNGGIIDLTPQLIELSLFEDIYSATISGNLVLSDALGLLSNFRINGTEFIQISIRKFSQDNNPIQRTFRVFKVSNRTVNLSNAYEVYTLNFCSEEFLFSEQYRISKGYRNTKISDIITDILTNYVMVGGNTTSPNSSAANGPPAPNNPGTKNIHIEPTKGVYDFVLPNKKLFETINWLSIYSQPANQPGADMLFYENNYGYFFNSLQSLYGQTAYQTYFYNPKNISTEIKDQVINVTDFQVLNFFDTLEAVSNGTFANKTITFDILTRTKRTNNMYSYDNYLYLNNPTTLNPYPVTNNYQNRRGDAMYQVMDGVDLEMGALRMATGNHQDKMNSYVMASKGGANNVANDIFIETYLKNRVGQLGLINYTRIKIIVPGDPSLAVGKTVNFKTFAVSPSTYSGGERVFDPFYSGKYLVTACRHVINGPEGTYITVLELSKESVSESYSAYNNSDPLVQSIVNGIQ